jgi:hypothetical protein
MRNLIFISIIIIIASCGSNRKQKSPEELKMELKAQERANPTQYLSITESTMTANKIREAGLFRDAEYDGWIIKGSILSSATLAKFKDVVINVELYSQTGTVIEEKDYVIYEFYEPGTIKSFSLKINTPEATNKYNVSIKSATATY